MINEINSIIPLLKHGKQILKRTKTSTWNVQSNINTEIWKWKQLYSVTSSKLIQLSKKWKPFSLKKLSQPIIEYNMLLHSSIISICSLQLNPAINEWKTIFGISINEWKTIFGISINGLVCHMQYGLPAWAKTNAYLVTDLQPYILRKLSI